MSDQISNTEEMPTADLLSCATAVAQTAEGDGYSEIVSAVATEYAQRSNLDYALDLAETISDPYLKDRTFGSIAAAGVDAGMSDLTTDLLDRIDDPSLLELAVEQVAMKHAEHGDFDQALDSTAQLGDPATAVSNIAMMCAKAGFQKKALDLVLTIEPPTIRAATLAQLASQAIDEGRGSEANELLHESAECTDDIEFTDERVFALAGLVPIYEANGQRELGVAKLFEAYELCDEIDDGSTGMSPTRDQALAQIAGTFAELAMFDKADEAIQKLDDPFQFAFACSTLARAYHKIEHLKQAEELLSEGVEVANEADIRSEQYLQFQQEVLSRLAFTYAVCGFHEKSLEVAKLINSTNLRSLLLEEIGKVLVSAGLDPAPPTKLMAEEYKKSSYWVQISDAYSKTETLTKVDEALRAAYAHTNSIEQPYEKGLALAELGLRYALKNEPANADKLFSEALSTIATIEDGYKKASALLDLSRKNKIVGRSETAEEQSVIEDIVARLE